MYFTFEEPVYLWFMLTIPLFIITHFWFLSRSKSKAMKFANFETLKRIAGDKLLTKNITQLTIRIIIMVSLIIAAAGTNFWVLGQENQYSFVVAIDSSASMTSEDVKPSRFEAAKTYSAVFVDELDSSANLGLVTFGGTTFVEQTLTDSKIDFKLALEKARVSNTGGTDIPGALITATNLLANEDGKGKSIVLVSDGVNTLGAFISDSVDEAIRYARNNQVIINTIGLGTNTGPVGYLPEYYNISSRYDENLLKTLAQETGGIYVYADNTDELLQAYRKITENRNEAYIRIPVSFYALLLSLFLLFIEWTLSNTLFRRVV